MRSLFALSLTLLAATAASAAPGDPRVVQGTLVWPSVLTTEKQIVVNGNDGTRYVADIATAHNVATFPLRAGDTIAFAGLEGNRPEEITVAAIGHDSAITLTASRATLPNAMAQAPTPTAALETAKADMVGEWQRVDGRVESVKGTTMELKTRDGSRINVDLSRVNHPNWLKAGQDVSVYGTPAPQGGIVAVGFIQREPSGSALSHSR